MHMNIRDTAPTCFWADVPSSRRKMYLITPWFYGPLRALASLIMNAHSSLSNAFSLHLLTVISLRSCYTSSSHLSLVLPILLLPSGLLSIFSSLSFPVPFLLQVQSIPINSLQFLLLCLDLYVAPSTPDQFLFSIFLALPPVHATFFIFSCSTYPDCSYPPQPQPMFHFIASGFSIVLYIS